MAALLQDHSEANALVLQWQDRWTLALDDAFLEGAPLLDASVADVVAQIPLARVLGSAESSVAERIHQWKRAVLDPHLRAAAADLPAGAGAASIPSLQPPALPPHPRPWLPGVVSWTWFVVACLLVVATVATTAAFALVPVMNVISTIVGVACGVCVAMSPGRFLRAHATTYWQSQARDAAGALRAAALQAIKDGAAGCLVARR